MMSINLLKLIYFYISHFVYYDSYNNFLCISRDAKEGFWFILFLLCILLCMIFSLPDKALLEPY